MDIINEQQTKQISLYGKVFRPIPDFNEYVISDDGEVLLSLKFGKVKRISYYEGKGSYLKTQLYKDGKSYKRYVHQVVAEAFLGSRPHKLEIDHIDRDRKNNHCNNLRYVSKQTNVDNTTHLKVSEIVNRMIKVGLTEEQINYVLGK